MSIEESVEKTKKFALEVITETFIRDQMTVDEFDTSCAEIENSDSTEAITALIEHLPSEIVESVKDRTGSQGRQVIRGKFSKQKRTGNWLTSQYVLVSWSFGRINLDLSDCMETLSTSGGTIEIDLRLSYAKCTLIVPPGTGVVEKLETVNNGKIRCSKSIVNRSQHSTSTVILRGKLVSSKVRIARKRRIVPKLRRITR